LTRGWRREWSGFAGIFIVTNLGLLAVGATLAVLPGYVQDDLDGSDLEVGIVSGAAREEILPVVGAAGLVRARVRRGRASVAEARVVALAGGAARAAERDRE
jgi:hypothetical protein